MPFNFMKSLLMKSVKIQDEIEHEQRKAKPDRFRLLKLKKISLIISDKLQRITRAWDIGQGIYRPVPARAALRKRR